MFEPPFCPNRRCDAHVAPKPRFYQRRGFYHPRCRAHPVPRFLCRVCGRSFSRQTFRMDYRDHRPHLNARLFDLMSSGVGLRQSSRILGLTLRCTELKFRKIARHLRRLNLNLRGDLPHGSTFHMDEFETYEDRRNTRPLSIPVLIESTTHFIVWAETATIRPRGRMTPKRRRAMEEDERRFGRRIDNSRHALQRTLRRGAALASRLERVQLATDKKSSYPRLAREAFGAERLVHSRTSSKIVRDTANPLFAINHTEAVVRDITSRARRQSWLVSKKRRYLDLGLQLHMAYRNLVRTRFNRDRPERSPAAWLGFAGRSLRVGEVLGWSQCWGARSPHPIGDGRRAVGSAAAA